MEESVPQIHHYEEGDDYPHCARYDHDGQGRHQVCM